MRRVLGWLLAGPGFALWVIGIGEGIIGAGFLWFLGGLALVAAGAFVMEGRKPGDNASAATAGTPASKREAAMRIAQGSGIPSVMAKRWLAAYQNDPSVPPFGSQPYWSGNGAGGLPHPLSMIAFQGVGARLEYVRRPGAESSLLHVMADDPDRKVQEAVRARLGSRS